MDGRPPPPAEIANGLCIPVYSSLTLYIFARPQKFRKRPVHGSKGTEVPSSSALRPHHAHSSTCPATPFVHGHVTNRNVHSYAPCHAPPDTSLETQSCQYPCYPPPCPSPLRLAPPLSDLNLLSGVAPVPATCINHPRLKFERIIILDIRLRSIPHPFPPLPPWPRYPAAQPPSLIVLSLSVRLYMSCRSPRISCNMEFLSHRCPNLLVLRRVCLVDRSVVRCTPIWHRPSLFPTLLR